MLKIYKRKKIILLAIVFCLGISLFFIPRIVSSEDDQAGLILDSAQDEVIILYSFFSLSFLVIFFISLGMFSFDYSIVVFILAFIFIVFAPLRPPGERVFKAVSLRLGFLGVYLFMGYVIYFIVSAVNESLQGNRLFVSKEKEDLDQKRREVEKMKQRNASLIDQSEQLNHLSRMLNAVLSEVDFTRIMKVMVSHSGKVFPESIVVFSMRDQDRRKDFSVRSWVNSSDSLLNKKLDNVDGIVRNMGFPILVADLRSEINYKIEKDEDCPFEYQSFIAAPVEVDEGRFGVLKCYNARPEHFNSNHLRLLHYISDMLSVLLSNAVLYSRTERMARTDGVTGLFVQHFFVETIEEEARRFFTDATEFSLLIIDVDNFKKFNDTWGHPFGDYVLETTARVIRQSIRTIDFPCRYGGDEFFLITPDTDLAGATALAERMHEAVQERTRSLIFEGKVLDRNITISIGVGQFRKEDQTAKNFIKRIDSLLYEAKKRGKNVVVSEDDV